MRLIKKAKISIFLISTATIPSFAFASDAAAHHPSVSDLILPAMNFALFLVIMVKLLKTPLQTQLRARKDNVESHIKRAAMQWDRARRQLLDVQRRFHSLDGEMKELTMRIASEGKKEAQGIVADAKSKADAIIRRAKDSSESERKTTEAQIRVELAQAVLKLASEKLSKEITESSDKQHRERALEGLRAIS